MKTLRTVNDWVLANKLRIRLAEAGIPSTVSNDSHQQYRVWVYFDSQYEAALELLAAQTHDNSPPAPESNFPAEQHSSQKAQA